MMTYKGPMWVPHGLKFLYGTHMGPIWASCPDSDHMGPISPCVLGLSRVKQFTEIAIHKYKIDHEIHVFANKLIHKIVDVFNVHPHFHYANMSVQYSAIFHGCKNDNFQMKTFDIFHIFAQNIDCWYTLEPPH